jgi:hypothetical protein
MDQSACVPLHTKPWWNENRRQVRRYGSVRLAIATHLFNMWPTWRWGAKRDDGDRFR